MHSATAVHHMDRPLRDLAAWVSYFLAAPIPVLDSTADALSELALHEDDVDAQLVASTVATDPLMTLKLLAHVSTDRRRDTGVETVIGALVLTGMGPFFRRFRDLPRLSAMLPDTHNKAEIQAGLQGVLDRSRRAARFALGFAAHRMDPDAPVIYEAALLCNFTEFLLWCHAPMLALEIARRQESNVELRSAVAQNAVLGIELADLQQALMRAWRLPELLIRLDDERHADSPQVKNVRLAVRLARHTTHGWNNAAIPDDLAEVASMLQLAPEPTLKLVQEIDA